MIFEQFQCSIGVKGWYYFLLRWNFEFAAYVLTASSSVHFKSLLAAPTKKTDK